MNPSPDRLAGETEGRGGRARFPARLARLRERVQALSAEVARAAAKLDATRRGDEWIARSYAAILSRLGDLDAALAGHDWLLSGSRLPHPLGFEEMLRPPDESGRGVSPAAAWRARLQEPAGKALQPAALKDVFDIYFQDLYGRLRDPDTIFLNRGISDPWYFSPPAGVSLALDVANRQNRFGYSDPLGHAATREAAAALERQRRKQPALTPENIAVTQGATQGLTSVLALLRQQGLRGKMLVPVPNYPPLVDQVEQHFTADRVELSGRYGWDAAGVRARLLAPDAVGLCLPVPHDPTTDGSVYEQLPELADLCESAGRYLLVVENGFSDAAGGRLDPLRRPSTVIMTSWSKGYGVAGLGIGHLVADRALIDRFYRYAGSAYGPPPSFLYLAAATLAALELGRRLGAPRPFEKGLAETLSGPGLLALEFEHWCAAEELHAEFGDLMLEVVSRVRWFDGLESVQADPVVPSADRVLRTRLRGCSYRTFLSVLAAKNVSLLPSDCLAPPADDRHDLRVTVAVRPGDCVRGLTAACEEVDNIYAAQSRADWLHPDDRLWLERAGLFGADARLNFWGHVRRVRLRLEQIARAAALDAPAHLPRAAALHDLGKVWSLVGRGRAEAEWARLAGGPAGACPLPIEEGELAVARRLLRAGEELDLPPLPPELSGLLEQFFAGPGAWPDSPPWPALLDLADKTSDFRVGEPPREGDLEECLRLKAAQLRLRYPASHERIEREFGRARESLRLIFRASRAPA